ncbi:MAG: hypothetical protein K6G80_11065, partial [Treponema sp.]|nr:hypothetical protein [Treponema sp.]
ISRHVEYGAYYDDEDHAYVYDPETQRMLKGLYTLDVGSDRVRVTEQGLVQVQATDWESGEKYWTQPSGAFSGTFFAGFWPGTGGGHSYDKFQIYLNPTGEHYLFTWHEESYGVFELYPPELCVYAWKNKSWKVQTASRHASALDPIFYSLSFIEKKEHSFDFEADEDKAVVTAYPGDGDLCIPVPFAFSYDQTKGAFAPYEKTVLTELAFGTPETLSALGDWKSAWEKNEAGWYPVQIFSYPAAFNPDPAMVRFLAENGLRIETEYADYKGRSESYHFTALEAWQAGAKSIAVRDALIASGASYSGEMLKTAFMQGSLSEVRELIHFVQDYAPLLVSVTDYYRNHRDEKQTLGYIKSCIEVLQAHGVDLNKSFEVDEKGQTGFFMELALNEAYTDLVRLYESLGVLIPEELHRYSTIGMGTPLGCVRYRFYDGYSDDNPDNQRVRDALSLLDYLLSKGFDINEHTFGHGNTMLHECCDGVWRGDRAFAAALFARGADANSRNDDGKTPLALLSEVRNWSENESPAVMEKILLAHGADPSLLTAEQLSELEKLRTYGNEL